MTDINDMTKEEKQGFLRTYEDDILGGILAAAGFSSSEDEVQAIEIKRNNITLIKFRIRPLSEEEYNKCRKKHTTYKRNKQFGISLADEVDTPAYRSELIYAATIAEDKEKIWNNKEAWRKLDVLSGPQLISSVLKAGEKDAIIDKLDEISGYSSTIEDTAKN